MTVRTQGKQVRSVRAEIGSRGWAVCPNRLPGSRCRNLLGHLRAGCNACAVGLIGTDSAASLVRVLSLGDD